MAKLLNPEPYSTIYDPTCGSGGLLIKGRLQFDEMHPDEKSQAPRIYGQELTPTTYAMAKMNAFLHDFIGADIQIGDTFAILSSPPAIQNYNVLTMWWQIRCGIRRNMTMTFTKTILGKDSFMVLHLVICGLGMGATYFSIT